MKGKIAYFRQGRHHTYPNHMIILPEGIESREKAEKLIGKKVIFKTTSGKEIVGKISRCHGKNGALRVVFEKGMPGQAIGKEVTIS